MTLQPTHSIPLAERVATLGDVLAWIPGIVFAYLFGSQSTGGAGPLSDVDVAVYLDDSVDAFSTKLTVADAVSRHVGSDRVDVVILNSASIALAGRILTTRRVIVDQVPFRRHRYESVTARLFQDFRIHEHRLLAQRYPRG